MELATFDNKIEETDLLSKFSKFSLTRQRAFVGIVDEGTPGSWYKSTNGEKVTHLMAFHPKELIETCLAVETIGGEAKFSAINCNEKMNFICKRNF